MLLIPYRCFFFVFLALFPTLRSYDSLIGTSES